MWVVPGEPYNPVGVTDTPVSRIVLDDPVVQSGYMTDGSPIVNVGGTSMGYPGIFQEIISVSADSSLGVSFDNAGRRINFASTPPGVHTIRIFGRGASGNITGSFRIIFNTA